ncbi:MAG TPA: hypothetical protein VHB70_11565 [Parafilimonas sp.]|nr:hypothetical protein [Parafilimonas sp.]
MTFRQIAKNRMYKKVLAFLNANAAAWAAFSRLVTQITTFTNANTTLDGFIEQQAQPSSGFTDNKNNILISLVADTVKTARKAMVYAIDQNDAVLETLFSVQVSDFFSTPQDAALAKIQNIYDGISPLAADLLSYNVSAGDITAIGDGITDFKAAEPGSGNARAARKAATKGIAVTMASIDAMLAVMDDLIIHGIADTNLVHEYRNNRKLHITGIRHTGIIATIDAANGVAIADAAMVIAALNKSAVSNLLGVAEIIKMKAGMYEVSFSAQGFASQTMILKVGRGELLEVSVNLVPVVQEMGLAKVA